MSYTIVVTDKERIIEQPKNNKTQYKSYYLVWGTDIYTGEEYTFSNKDSLIRMKFNSSDIQGKLHVGETYVVTIVGVRIPYLSMYQNIIFAEKFNDGAL